MNYEKMTDKEIDELLVEKLNKQAAPAQPDFEKMSDDELDNLLMEKIATNKVPQVGEIKIDPENEANLGVALRAQYSIEPLESNRIALLQRELGQENVKVDDQTGDVYARDDSGSFRPVNIGGFSMADVADFAGSVPETLGAVAGGVLGSSLPGAGTVAGAIGGAAVGSAARQGLSLLLGTPDVASGLERAGEIGLSASMGALGYGAGKALKPVANAAKTFTKRVGKKTADLIPDTVKETAQDSYRISKDVINNIEKVFRPSRAEDAPKYFDIMAKHGLEREIAPESVEFGLSSAISRRGRHIAEGPLGEERLKNYYKFQSQIGDAMDTVVEKIGTVKERADLGASLRDTLENVMERAKDMKITYSKAVKDYPGAQLSEESMKRINSKLRGIRRFAVGRIKRGFGSQKTEGQELLNMIETFKNTKGSLKQVTEALQNLGEEAFKKHDGNRIPVDKKAMQKLYFTLRDEVVETIREVGGDDAAEELLRNNKILKEMIDNKGVFGNLLSRDNLADENLIASIIDNPDTRKIEALKALLSPEELAEIKASMMDNIIKRNADGFVSFKTTFNNLNAKKKKDAYAAMFEPEELADLGELIALGQRTGDPILSKSGTGASNAFSQFVSDLKDSAQSEQLVSASKRRARKRFELAAKKSLERSQKRRKGLIRRERISREITKKAPGSLAKALQLTTDPTQRELSNMLRGPNEMRRGLGQRN